MTVPTPGLTPVNSTMSIAVSGLVLPSASLFVMVTALCVAAASIGILVSLGVVGHLEPIFNAAIGVVSVLSSMWGWFGYRRTSRPVRIMISGNGQIRIVEMASAVADAAQVPVAAHLLSGSTLWAHLLLLRFQLDNGWIKSVVILPDCVPEDIFRALSVACRWVASRGHAIGPEKVRYAQPIG
jgi:toxin CptA